MPFEKGNQLAKGRKSSKDFSDMLRIAVKEAQGAGGNKLRKVADALVSKAIEGDVPAIREIADRLEGKVAQQVDLKGEIESTVKFVTYYEPMPKDKG